MHRSPSFRTPSLLGAALVTLGSLLAPRPARAAFGYTDNGAAYVVDTGAGLVFQVDKASGDISSIVFNGIEYKGPSGKGTHIASGLGTPTTVTPETDGASYVKLTLQTSADNPVATSLTHYLVVRSGENTIYMATFPTAEPAVGELRWITRLDQALVPNGPGPSTTATASPTPRIARWTSRTPAPPGPASAAGWSSAAARAARAGRSSATSRTRRAAIKRSTTT